MSDVRADHSMKFARTLARDDRGFTLVELLVVILLMGFVAVALHSIFSMSLRVLSVGSNSIEATEEARIGLSRLERELRGAYPDEEGELFPGYSGSEAESITFYAAGEGYSPGDQITYDLSEESTEGKFELERNGEPLAGDIRDENGDGHALYFEFLNAQEIPAESEDSVRSVRISLETDARSESEREQEQAGGSQILRTEVSLRNREGS